MLFIYTNQVKMLFEDIKKIPQWGGFIFKGDSLINYNIFYFQQFISKRNLAIWDSFEIEYMAQDCVCNKSDVAMCLSQPSLSVESPFNQSNIPKNTVTKSKQIPFPLLNALLFRGKQTFQCQNKNPPSKWKKLKRKRKDKRMTIPWKLHIFMFYYSIKADHFFD